MPRPLSPTTLAAVKARCKELLPLFAYHHIERGLDFEAALLEAATDKLGPQGLDYFRVLCTKRMLRRNKNG